MKLRTIAIEDQSYPFLYGQSCLEEIAARLADLDADKLILVTDRTVGSLYAGRLKEALPTTAQVLAVELEDGEASKSLRVLERVAEQVVDAGVSRRSVVVALGGGVPGNFGGLLAALLFRGIRLVHIPTTVVAVLDSVLSLKQAVNSGKAKNLFGTYHCPTMVLADLDTLTTLPAEQVRSGLCEVVKNALAITPDRIPRLRRLLEPSARYTGEEFAEFLESSIDAKLQVMRNDKRECRRGLILEYGHTFGHALELLHREVSNRPISHGEAVGVGMLIAAQASAELGILDETAVEVHYELLDRAGARLHLPEGLRGEDLLELAGYDNKRGYRAADDGSVDMVLLRELGVPSGPAELPLTSVPHAVLEKILTSLAAPPRKSVEVTAP